MDAIEISGRRAASFAISGTIANSGTLERGQYDVVSDVDCSVAIERGTPVNPALSATNGYPLYANRVVPMFVGEAQQIYAMTSGATGTLKYIKTGN